ncbi:M23 family metallopeptidase [Candidatus Peregrinibacteria bacterium]|nr:MAG: M23 family metallopeptidase [Candidatus Peregrinibacteria bacterium]
MTQAKGEAKIVYMHMIENSLQVKVGEEVVPGQIIGYMGSTGHSVGQTCTLQKENPLNGKMEEVTVSGVHLHLEARTNEGAHPIKTFMGQIEYPEPANESGQYLSASRVSIDTNNYWGDYGYRYDYKMPPEAWDGKTFGIPEIHSITPLVVQPNQEVVFTVKGAHLPSELKFALDSCLNPQALEKEGNRDPNEQRFRCTMSGSEGERTGWLQIDETMWLGAQEKAIKTFFRVQVQPTPNPEKTQVNLDEAEHAMQMASPGSVVVLTIPGKNLTGDLVFESPGCGEVKYLLRSASVFMVQCAIPGHLYQEGERREGVIESPIVIKDHAGNTLAESSFSVDYGIKIARVYPAVATYGIRETFTITGKGVHTLMGAHIEQCADLEVDRSKQDHLLLTCTLVFPKRFFAFNERVRQA